MKLKDGQLGIALGPLLVPVKFISPDEVFLPQPQPPGEALIARYHPAGNGETAHLLASLGEANLDYNDGPLDPPGADRREWDAYLGDYHIDQWGRTAQKVKIQRRNGYLYLDGLRLIVEHEPGLFFTATGEAVDFRTDPATWHNIQLVREA